MQLIGITVNINHMTFFFKKQGGMVFGFRKAATVVIKPDRKIVSLC
jgi:hypothetical protein